MRVLHLTAGNLFGGVETYLATLARQRSLAPDMVPEFGVCFPGRLADELTASGVRVHHLGPVRMSRPWTTWAARRRLAEVLRSGRFDVAVTHSSWPHAVFAPVARRAGVRLVTLVHDNLAHPSWLDRQAARTPPDLAIANSRFTAASASRIHRTSPMETLYYPVSPPALDNREAVRREVRSALGTATDTVVILQASRLETWKGQAVHVDALARLAEVPGWEAWVAGGPQKAGEQEYLDTLRQKVADAGLAKRVRFLGQRKDVPRLMAAADIFCQPNTGPEPFGIVYVEALYSGLPVVASSIGGAIEIVTEGCGVLTPPNDAEAVADALLGLIRDENRRRGLGAAGPRRASSLCNPFLSLSQLCEQLVRLKGPARVLRIPAVPHSPAMKHPPVEGSASEDAEPIHQGIEERTGANHRGLRVLRLTAGNLYGGIETYLCTLARHRRLTPDMDTQFGLCFPGRLADQLAALESSVYDFGAVRLSRPWTVWRARRRLASVLESARFNVVVTHSSWPHVVFAPTVRQAGVRLVHMVHDYLGRPTWLDRWAAATPPDLVLANSRFTAEAASRLYPQTEVRFLYHPVSPHVVPDRTTTRREVRSGLATPPDLVVILQASRLERWKGHAILLDALARLADLPNWEAWIAGGPQKAGEAGYLSSLKRQARRAGLEGRVRFLGQREDVPSLMAAADIFCQPNTGPEPFGNVFVEALCAGLPVITSAFGGAVEIVNESCGVLTPPGDAASVARAVRELMHNPERRRQLEMSGPARAANLCDPARQMNCLRDRLISAN